MSDTASTEWNEERLVAMIEHGVEESTRLDYKAAGALDMTDAKKSEIVRDVTSFANAAGGVIIYGIAEFQEKARQHLPERLDPIMRPDISKEWLEQVIESASPKIEGIRILAVRIGGQGDRVVYVVEIPPSTTAHQAKDHRYYRRRNFKVSPMEDYEIREVMNRSARPIIEFEARIDLDRFAGNGSFRLRIRNRGTVMARHYQCTVLLPQICSLGTFVPLKKVGITEVEVGDDKWAFQFRIGPEALETGAPLFPSDEVILERSLARGEMVDHRTQIPRDPAERITVRFFADSNPPLVREFVPADIIGRWK